MTFLIPKSLKSVNSLVTAEVIEVELNDVDVDRMMTHILELAVKRGRRAGSKTDAKDYEGFLSRLASNPNLVGFVGEEGADVLDGWLRTSVLQMERSGLKRSESQMGYLRPLTIAAYRSGLPKQASRHRKGDVLAYRSMSRLLTKRGQDNPSAFIEDAFVHTFGRGADLGVTPWASPRYDGSSLVDIDTLLALRFLEGFEGNAKLAEDGKDPLEPPVPAAVDPLAEDLLAFLALYGPEATVGDAYSQISAILSLRLFQLPLVSARILRTLLQGEANEATGNGSELYCDFVRRRGSASDELSRLCVLRDLEIMRGFFGDRLLIRSLAQAVDVLPEKRDLGATAEERLTQLARSTDDPMMGMALMMRIQEIENALEEDDEQGRAFISEIRGSGLAPAQQITSILVEGLRKRGLENQVKWFWSTGGITKPYGVLSGTLKARSTWRYAPKDECLTALLSMCFVEADGTRTARRLPITEVLARLEKRFGILIDRPPSDMDSADARSGASENLTAFTRQLQLLGCFQGLSDDFNAQFVNRPREAVQ